MRLTDLMTGMLAKASRVALGKHTGADLFGSDFDQRKDHLHQEVKVDRRGRVSKRWVSNAPRGSTKKKEPQQQPLAAQGNMPSLFAAPEPTPKKRASRPKKEKAAPEAPLFGFDFSASLPTPTVTAAKPAPQPEPDAPLPVIVQAAQQVAQAWNTLEDAPALRKKLTGVVEGSYRLTHGDLSTLLPGEHARQGAAMRMQKDFARATLAQLPATDTLDFQALVEKTRAKLTGKTDAPAPANDSLTMTQDEYRAQNAGMLQVGSTKQENGRTYRLNSNHRWERVQDEPAPAQAAAPAGPDAQARGRQIMSAWKAKQGTPPSSALSSAVMQAAQRSAQDGKPYYVTADEPPTVTDADPGDQQRRYTVDASAGTVKGNLRRHLAPAPSAPATTEDGRRIVSQRDYDLKGEDGSGVDEQTGRPAMTYWEDGKGTVLGEVHIHDRDRPLSVQTASGHLSLHVTDEPGVLRIDGVRGGTVRRGQDGEWYMRVGQDGAPVHLTASEDGSALSVTKKAPADADPTPTPTPAASEPATAAPAPAADPEAPEGATENGPPRNVDEYVEQQLAGKTPKQLRAVARMQIGSEDFHDRAHTNAARDPDSKWHTSDTAREAFKTRHRGLLAAVIEGARERLGWDKRFAFKAKTTAPSYDEAMTPDAVRALPKFGFELLTKSTKARRIAANQEAIALSERLAADGTEPTPSERAVLAQYTGDGGTNGDLNAHYTPTGLAGAMWRLMHRAGFTTGTVLEPSMGAGVFFETAPAGAHMHGVELSPVTQRVASLLHPEATVADPQPFERFHTNNPEVRYSASISNPPYGSRGQVASEMDKPEIQQAERYFLDTVLDKLEDDGLSVSLTNPGPFEGGDDARAFRARLLARADILGVYQLPQSVFEDSESDVPPVVLVMRKRPHAVGMTLAKMVEKHGEDALRHAGAWSANDAYTDAFMDGTLHLQPENMFGTFTGGTTFKGYKKIEAEAGPELLAQLAEAGMRPHTHISMPDLEDKLGAQYGPQEVDAARTRAAAYGVAKEGQINAGRIYTGGRWRSMADVAPELDDATSLSNILKQLTHVRNNGQTGDAEALRQNAEARVREFLGTHGNPHEITSIRDAAKHNHILANLMSAVTRDGNLARHVTTPLQDADTGAENVDKSDLHAVATYLHSKGRLTPEHVARLWTGAGGDRDDAERALLNHPDIALTEDGRHMPASAYFHGNVYDRAASLDAQAEKAEDPQIAKKYREQAERFRTMLPRRPLEDIDLTPRDKWLPPEVVEAFMHDTMTGNVTVTQHAGVFYVHGPTTPEVEEMRKYLNYAQKPDDVRNQKNKSAVEIAAERAANMEAVQARIKHIESSFASWLSGSEHRDTAEEAYNKAFNSYIPETLSTEPLDAELNGWTGPKLHDFQRQDVRFMMQQGGGITALDVGLGKTYTGAALIDELQRSGKAKKPMAVVPRGLLPNWRQTFEKAHEDANVISNLTDDAQHGRRILVIGQTFKGQRKNKQTGEMEDHWQDDSGDVVAQKLVRAANENWHAVVITRDWHSRIPLRPETWMQMVESDVQKQRNIELDEADEDDYGATGKRRRAKGQMSLRDKEAERADALAKAARKLFRSTANPLNWEDLGVDAMICDEAHAYKNLYAAPPALGGDAPKFMGAGGESKRAQDFNYKARHLRTKNGGHGVYFLTATPTKNSPLEVFNMLSHVTDALSQRGIGLTDDFVSRYCKIEPQQVPTLDGAYETKPCVVGFKNLSELRGLLGQHVFRRTKDSEDVKALPGWHVPERDDQEHEIEMEPEVHAAYRGLAESAKAASQTMGGFDDHGRHVFSYLADMRKLTLDPQLLGVGGDVNPRFKKAAEIAMNAHREGGKTVMFMDLGKQRGDTTDEGEDARSEQEINDAAVEYGLPNAAGMKPADRKKAVLAYENSMQTNAYDRLVNHLVKEGVPRDRIAVVTGETAKNSQARQDIKDRFNAGHLSVVIGSTPVIGEGFSLQRGTTDMVHLDQPWDPGTYQQRLGRAQRQGNKLATVRNHILLAKDSFDAVTYSTMLGKQGWMQHLWDGSGDDADNAEASSSNLEDIAAMLDGDPTKFKELAEQRKREAAERQEAAANALTVDKVRRYARQNNAVHSNDLDYAKMTREVDQLERDLPSAPATKQDEIRAGIARKRGQLVKIGARKDKIRREAEGMRKMLLQDPRLQDRHRQLLEMGHPFLLDDQGGEYVAGGTFTDAQGRARLVTGINPKTMTVTHRPLVPSFNPSDWQNQPKEEALTDMEGASDHQSVRSEATEREMLTHVLDNRHPLSAMRRIHPDLLSKHADWVQEHLRSKDLRNPYGGVWSVGPDGKAQYNAPTGAANGLNPLPMPEGHRYLLNTHDDRQRLVDALNEQPAWGEYRPAGDSPAESQASYDRLQNRNTYGVRSSAQITGSHIVKADGATGSLTDLYASMLACKPASTHGKVQA